MTQAFIAGVAETQYVRHPASKVSTRSVLADAARLALDDAHVQPRKVDGLGVSSLTLHPDRCIDFAVGLGLKLRWLMDGATGGSSAIDMLQHAVRAIEAGDAETILLVAGDVFRGKEFGTLVSEFNLATREHLAQIPLGGPNALFAFITQTHMATHQLERADYARLVIAQRNWASLNPRAIYRSRLSVQEYLEAPLVAAPLGLLDCAPIVSGGNAIVVTGRRGGVRIRAIGVLHNSDLHEGDGLTTGLSHIAPELWEGAGVGPENMDVVSVYDDYPAMALVQLTELGYGEPQAVLAALDEERLAVNTSGGQLSAGQAGAAGGIHGLVEIVSQLQGRAGHRQVASARLGIVSGYGMVAYRYGVCSGATLLEAP